MSITALSFPQTTCKKAGIMSISALSFSATPPKGRHHEHQCAVISAGYREEASIMSITALSFPQDAAKRPASRASLRCHFRRTPPRGQHHEHQCAVISAGRRQRASIMSITALSFSAGRRQEASIMSISALSFPQNAAKRPAS